MASVKQHYDELLAPIYVWMAGGLEAALATGARDVAPFVPGQGVAVDLGAGFGMHAVPLAAGGYEVVALDTSARLLDVLSTAAGGSRIRAIEADLRDFRRFLAAPASLIVCLGDTLTHLDDHADVDRLVHDMAASLAGDGRIVLTFRDYTTPATGVARFIPVRSDAQRIHTCFLEALPQHMLVHDIVHERNGGAWQMCVSSYRKLRLDPAVVAAALRAAGLTPTIAPGPRGMVCVSAAR